MSITWQNRVIPPADLKPAAYNPRQHTEKQQADIDFCMKVMLKKRIIFIDDRFSFVCKRFTNSGGSAGIRSQADYKAQLDRLQKRWGPLLSIKDLKGTARIALNVQRRQPLEIS